MLGQKFMFAHLYPLNRRQKGLIIFGLQGIKRRILGTIFQWLNEAGSHRPKNGRFRDAIMGAILGYARVSNRPERSRCSPM